ncbi:MAG: hypothetical protein EBZ95_12260, partial [Chitinophagia bacterium]|nr:hypothetical protein [Chitinophagia bacterium]
NSTSSISFTIDAVGGVGQITQVGVVYGIAKGLTTSSTLCKPNASTPTFGSRIATISYSGATSTTLTVSSTETANSQGTTTFYVAPYYAKLYAIKNGVTYYGPEIEFLPNWPTASAAGKTWLQANLGALGVATSSTDTDSYGWYYNWGKPTDGHQFKNSPTSATQFSSDTPTPGIFTCCNNNIIAWQTTPNTNLWSGVSGINNPCPSGWRLPTKSEWETLLSTPPAITNSSTAFSSNLKLPASMGRDRTYGNIMGSNTNNLYWSGDGSNSTWAWHHSGGIATGTFWPTYGAPVRCVQN